VSVIGVQSHPVPSDGRTVSAACCGAVSTLRENRVQSVFFPQRAAAAFFAISLRFPLGMRLRASTAAALAIVAISRRRSGESDAALMRARAAAGFSGFLRTN
jgi:hypothetical protein